MSLKLSDIEAGYGAIRVLKGISLEVGNGSIVTLLGPNGAGKTTTIRVISGLLRASSGGMQFNGENLSRSTPENIVKRGIVPEGRRVFARLSVMENLRMGAYSRKDSDGVKKDLDKIWDIFPALRSRTKQLAGSLSGGEQQMLAVARGLMARPSLMLLDEPSMGLAPKLVSEIFRTIKYINSQEKMSILLVEQNARMALEIANYGYILRVGSMILEGPAERLKENDEVVRSYLGTLYCDNDGIKR
jgi:branched-chain amino acid transport system ATP-binding protein